MFTGETPASGEPTGVAQQVPGEDASEISLDSLPADIRIVVDLALVRTKPPNEGTRNKMVFQFCQWLKGIPEWAELPAGRFRPLVREWHQRALPKIETKPFDETWADFCHGWKRVEHPNTNLPRAIRAAVQAETPLPEAEKYDTEAVRLLTRTCYEFQLIRGEETFWLSYRDVEVILGCSRRQAGKYLEMLMADEIITKVAEHTSKKAPRYRYTGPSIRRDHE